MRRWVAVLALALSAGAGPATEVAAAQERPLPLPPSASRLLTQVGPEVPSVPGFRSGFEVEAADGYEVGVRNSESGVVLTVSRGSIDSGVTVTSYLARGVATSGRLQATFGRFGRISMRFRESRKRTWSGKRRTCRGKDRFVKREGVFLGNLRFRGEGGYVSFRLHRAKGFVTTVATKCRHDGRPKREQAQADIPFLEEDTGLLASAWDGANSTRFLTFNLRDESLFLTLREEATGKLAISRLALAFGDNPLRINEAATSAAISPPPPFQGTGRYRAAPDGTTTWTGNLSVNFPGSPRYPLTGPQFDVLLEAPF